MVKVRNISHFVNENIVFPISRVKKVKTKNNDIDILVWNIIYNDGENNKTYLCSSFALVENESVLYLSHLNTK